MSLPSPPLGDSGRDDDLRTELERLSFHPQFAYLALHLCKGNAADAEDVLQEARINLLTGTLPTGVTLGGWIRVVVRNAYISKIYRRREARRWEGTFGDSAPYENRAADQPAVDDHVVGSLTTTAFHEEMRRAIAGLSDTLRPVAELAFDLEHGYYPALSLREIAEILTLDEKTVKSRLHSIRAKLREQLGRPSDDEETP